jgi:hypothetical protein
MAMLPFRAMETLETENSAIGSENKLRVGEIIPFRMEA